MKQFFLLCLVFFGISFQGIRGFMSCKDLPENTPPMELTEYLFCVYDHDVRPTPTTSRNLTVVEFALEIQHFQVDENANMVDFYVFTKMEWTDPHLTWTPATFGDINAIHVAASQIWVPDITLHSSTNQYVDTNVPAVSCNVNYNGVVLCVPPTVYTTYCESDHTWWPYDAMNCTIHIASWSYAADEIQMEFPKEALQTETIYRNSEWDIVGMSVYKHVIESKFPLGFTSDFLSYNVLLKRYSSMYTNTYATMAVVLMMMTLMVLWLEPSSTERITLANLNFVLHLLALQDLKWKIFWIGANPPKLLTFYENSLILATFSLILTSILRYMQRLNVDAPLWMSSTSGAILKSRTGQIFLISLLDRNVSTKMELNADDNTNLVTPDERNYTWKYISVLIGWLAFFSIVFVYAIMLILLFPTSTSPSSFTLNT